MIIRIRTIATTLPALSVFVVLGACASGGGGGTGVPGATPDRIVRAELEALGPMDAYEAVRELRPAWLRVRNQTEPPVVYLNNTRFGNDPTALRGLQSTGIEQMEHLNATDATTRFGLGHTGGAIVVTELDR